MSDPEDQCARAGDASLYVFGELYGRQKESFARHLRRCEECAEEVGLLRNVADSTPLLGTAYLPPEEEEDPGRRAPTPTLTVAAANARAARLAAEEAGLPWPPPKPPGSHKPSGRPILRTIPGGGGGAGGAGSRPQLPSLRARRRLLKTPLPKSAMVGLLALAVLAIATVALSSRAASVRFFRIQAGWSKGGAALQLVGNQLELLVKGMPEPASGTGYEVWIGDGAHKQLIPTTAWIHLNGLGEAGVKVFGNYHDWKSIAVFVEPLTGRETTHSGAVVVGDLRSLS
jgi:hypothetical protein